MIGCELGRPSKMPGYAFGISAKHCITGSKLVKVAGSVCSGCYALKGNYQFRVVARAHARRYRALRLALRDPRHARRWIDAMSRLVNAKCAREPWFRWHDSGDLQSVGHLGLIAEVCRNTPTVQHWLPTREYAICRQWAQWGIMPDNLCIRLSDHMVGGRAAALALAAELGAGFTASAVQDSHRYIDGETCPAPWQGNACVDCRACWKREHPLTVYTLH